jgi:lipoate-protein ligase B
MSGAWADGGKFAAIGFYLKRWVTLHGMSFNVDVDLSGFGAIVPCGLEGQPVASMRTLLGEAAPSRAAVRDRLAHHYGVVCGRRLTMFHWPEALPEALAKVLTA